MARALTASEEVAGPPEWLSPEQAEYLVELMAGTTVADLADLYHLSERTMHRRLSGVYKLMCVTGRSEAIAQASRWDLGRRLAK